MASYPSRLISLLIILCCVLCSRPLSAAENDVAILDVRLDMYFDPEFEARYHEVIVSDEPIALWMRALEQDNPELHRITLDTLAIAHRRGMKGIDQTAGRILQMLEQDDLEVSVRVAAVRSLIEIGGARYAARLAEIAAERGGAITTYVEPALIRWESDAMREQWIARLTGSGLNKRALLLAIRGTGALGESDASESLAAILQDRLRPTDVRVAAARALGQIHQQGLSEMAAAFVADSDGGLLNEICASVLLVRHRDPEAIDVLKSLANSRHSVVQAGVLRTLFEIDPNQVLPFVDSLLTSPDANVRRVLADALVWSESPDSTRSLATLLDDVNPSLRRSVAADLVRLAQDDTLRESVTTAASGILDADQWRGCEQAARVLVSLDHKPCGDRLVDLMEHPRGEVRSTAGWGLRRLALEQHLPAMLGRANSIHQGFRSGTYQEDTPGIVDLMAQLMMAFGQMQYEDAEPLIRKYLPRNDSLGTDARAGACYAIGLLHKGDAPEDLVQLLTARLNDVYSMTPEYESVRQTSAISLGRMNAESALPMLRKHAGPNVGTTNQACHWSIEKMTGETPPPIGPAVAIDYQDWFLRPLEPDDESLPE